MHKITETLALVAVLHPAPRFGRSSASVVSEPSLLPSLARSVVSDLKFRLGNVEKLIRHVPDDPEDRDIFVLNSVLNSSLPLLRAAGT